MKIFFLILTLLFSFGAFAHETAKPFKSIVRHRGRDESIVFTFTGEKAIFENCSENDCKVLKTIEKVSNPKKDLTIPNSLDDAYIFALSAEIFDGYTAPFDWSQEDGSEIGVLMILPAWWALMTAAEVAALPLDATLTGISYLRHTKAQRKFHKLMKGRSFKASDKLWDKLLEEIEKIPQALNG